MNTTLLQINLKQTERKRKNNLVQIVHEYISIFSGVLVGKTANKS